MNIEIKHVHVGHAIDKRRQDKGLTKAEFGRKIDVPQQHVNRILERETMETNRLIKVSEVLDFNFFSLFCPVQHQISAYLAAVSTEGDANNIIGDNTLVSQLEVEKSKNASLSEANLLLKEQIEGFKVQIERLESHLKDRGDFIEFLKGQLKQQE